MFNTSLSHCYGILKDAVDKLMKTDIKIYKPELNSKWRINVCSSAEYYEDKGAIVVKFTDDIMPYLDRVKEKFVLYSLKEIADLNSIYSTRLYELVQEYKTTGWFIRTVEDLREIFAVGKSFKLYKDFKRRTFMHACNEINQKFGIDLEFKEEEEGRKVKVLKFVFNKEKLAT